ETRVAFAGAARAVPGVRQKESQVELLELELETAGHTPATGNILRELSRQLRGQPCRLVACRIGRTRRRLYEQAVGIAIEDHVARVLEPAFRPQQDFLSHAGDRVCERRVVEAAGGR